MSNREAARAYKQPTTQGGNPRETECRALLESARRLAEAQNSHDDREAMRTAARLNWRLWTIFQAEITAPECSLPSEIRQNMINLCNFVDKRTVDVLAQPDPQKIDVLININRQIAAGLLTNPRQDSQDLDDQTRSAANTERASGGLSI